MRVEVRNNNVDKAMKILKKKLTEDGLFNELREREAFVSKGEKKRHERDAAKRRQKRNLEKRMEERGY
jgi:small subunit ribosomal protein S21|tara:strand:- start:377 stop:580 length:204 start_codon:yes stop_codon:yes gene_type:complete